MTLITEATPIGFELSAISRQFSVELFSAGGAKTIHNDDQAARREGLPGAIVAGPQVAALIFRMMREGFEGGWIVGGRAALTFRRSVGCNDFATARGVVAAKQPEGDGLRVTCEVWVETEAGVKAIVGTCSGLVGRAR